MYDAFISYRRSSGFYIAKMLRELLKLRGITPFMDLDELKSGTFDDKIADAIRSSPSFILVLSPGSLERCSESKDWVAKEIQIALDENKNIIPLLCDGFTFPSQWEGESAEKLKALANYNGVTMNHDYVDAMVERIVQRIREGNPYYRHSFAQLVSDKDSFFRNRMQTLSEVEGVDLAFHAGSEWFENIDRLDILTDLADADIPLRVLINTPEAAESLGQHMRHKYKKYTSFQEAVELWKNFSADHPTVSVRISSIPMLRIYYAFRMKNEADNAIRVKYYTYGNAKINKNFAQNFEPTDNHFSLYREEFEFLWNKAEEL